MAFAYDDDFDSYDPEALEMHRRIELDGIGALACTVLGDLYRAVSGAEPQSVRSYTSENTLLVLMRYDVGEILDGWLSATPTMIASAILQRTGAIVTPGNLSSCPERGLLVLAFDALDEHSAEHEGDPFSLDGIWDERPVQRVA